MSECFFDSTILSILIFSFSYCFLSLTPLLGRGPRSGDETGFGAGVDLFFGLSGMERWIGGWKKPYTTALFAFPSRF